MITKDQAVKLGDGTLRDEIHCEVVRTCKRTTGPRGGIKESIVRVRPNGKCQTWKRNPEKFRLPIKYGLYEYGEIANYNAASFHLAGDCPALVDLRIAAELQKTIDETKTLKLSGVMVDATDRDLSGCPTDEGHCPS